MLRYQTTKARYTGEDISQAPIRQLNFKKLMDTMLKRVLAELLQPEKPLHENHLARHLYVLLERRDFKVSDKNDTLSWNHIISLPNVDGTIPDIENNEDSKVDESHKEILIKGIKKIPILGHHLRLNFSDKDGNPVSNVIMGVNGVGKTSFYGALESFGMGSMKTAALHGADSKDYIKNIFTSSPQISAVLQTKGHKHRLDVIRPETHCVPAFFISEWDIRELESTSRLGDFIFKQLGVDNFYDLIRVLRESISLLDQELLSLEALHIKAQEIEDDITAIKYYLLYLFHPQSSGIEENINEDLPRLPDLIIDRNLIDDATDRVNDIFSIIDHDIEYNNLINSEEFPDLSSRQLKDVLDRLAELIERCRNSIFFKPFNDTQKTIDKYNDLITQINLSRIKLKGNIGRLTEQNIITPPRLLSELSEKQGEYIKLEGEINQDLVYSVISSLSPTTGPQDFINKIKDLLSEIVEVLQEEFDKIINKWLDEIIRPAVETLLTEFLEEEHEEILIKYDAMPVSPEGDRRNIVAGNNKEIIVELHVPISDAQSQSVRKAITSPREYFNTFRFKMFVVSLKIALAYCAKQIYHINWPIVIDDVFNSSDFNNRTHLGGYIAKILSAYEVLPEIKDMEFQLIFFTQDEVIGNSLFRGLKEEGKKAKLMRLHDYRCVSKDEVKESNAIKYKDIASEVASC